MGKAGSPWTPSPSRDDGLALARSPAPQQLQAASAAAGEKMAQELAWFKLVSDNLAKVTILGDQVQQELAKAVSLWGLLARALRDLLLQFTSSDISYFLLLILRDANSDSVRCFCLPENEFGQGPCLQSLFNLLHAASNHNHAINIPCCLHVTRS